MKRVIFLVALLCGLMLGGAWLAGGLMPLLVVAALLLLVAVAVLLGEALFRLDSH